jgi:MATE family multidrug resistance protein
MGDVRNDSRIAAAQPDSVSESGRGADRPSSPGLLPRPKLSRLSKALWAISLPIIFVGVGEQIVDVTDTALLSRYGIVELGAVGLADTIYEMLTVLIIGLVDGMQIVIARRIGQRNDRAVGETFNQGLALLVMIALAIIGVIALGASGFCHAVFDSAEIAAAVSDFLFYASLGLPFQAACFAYAALFVALSRTRALIGAAAVLAVTNVALDYGLIFGHFGLPELGIRGAALGSAGAEFATCAFLTAYALRRLDVRRYGLFRLGALSGRLTQHLAGISMPVAMQALLEGARWFLFFVIIEQLGERPLALANIVYACYALFLIPAQAFAETICSVVSRLVGRGREGRLALVLRTAVGQVYLTTLPVAGLVLLLPWLMLEMFSGDPGIIAECVGGLRVIALALLVVIPGEVWLAAVVGTGDTRAAFVIELVLGTAMLGFAYSAASLALPLSLVWMSLPLGWSLGLIASVAWVRGGRWKRLQI